MGFLLLFCANFGLGADMGKPQNLTDRETQTVWGLLILFVISNLFLSAIGACVVIAKIADWF